MLSQRIPTGFFDTCLLSLDTETTCRYDPGGKPDPHRDRTLLISLSNGERSIVLKPDTSWLPELWAALKSDLVTIGHNFSFDLQFLWALGFEGNPTKIWDTMLAEQVLIGGLQDAFNLSATAWRRTNVMMEKDTRLTFTHHAGEFSERQLAYSLKDAEVLIPIMHRQYAEAQAKNLLDTVELENATLPTVARMEYVGIGFDCDAWANTLKKEQVRARELERQVQLSLHVPDYSFDLLTGNIVGINLNSWKQVLAALYNTGIRVENTRAETLKLYLAEHPDTQVLRDLMEHRHVVKCMGYDYPRYVNPTTGRIHTSVMQIGAQTGRASSSHPNLQNVPRESDYRKCFVAQPGWVLVRSDSGQQEMRILAEVSGDEVLREVCRHSDVHLQIGRRMYHDPTMLKSNPLRDTAKNCGFAMSYGAQPKKIAIMADISLADATTIVQFVTSEFPVAMQWCDRQIELANSIGYVCTIGGRRRNFLKIEDKWINNQARNAPIQGTAADVMKRALWQINMKLLEGGYRAQPVLTVHDEVLVESPEEEAQDVAQLVVQEMVAAGEFYVKSVPMPADVTIARCWQK